MGINPPIYLFSHTPYAGVIHLPLLQTHFLHPEIDFDRYEGLIITSKQTLLALDHYERWHHLPILAISEPTARACRARGLQVIKSAQGYGAQIASMLGTRRWLYPRPRIVAQEWARGRVEERIVYETHCAHPEGEIDPRGILIFTSPSIIRCFVQHFSLLPSHTVVVIGEMTARALPEGIAYHVSATPSIEACVTLAHILHSSISSPF